MYKNCHYKYNDRICELIDFLPDTASESSRVRIRFLNNTETVCLQSELAEIPLTESILQSCYKSKTYVRDGNWDIIWHLGGKNNVTIGEKSGKYFLLPIEKSNKTIIDILPWEIIKSDKIIYPSDPKKLTYLSEFERQAPEVGGTINFKRI